MEIHDKSVYQFLDQLMSLLRAEGFPDEAADLHEVIYEVRWATSSEFYGELGLAIKRVMSITDGDVSTKLQNDLKDALNKVRTVWPEL